MFLQPPTVGGGGGGGSGTSAAVRRRSWAGMSPQGAPMHVSAVTSFDADGESYEQRYAKSDLKLLYID